MKNQEEEAITKEKKLEFWLGIFFLIPPILGVIAFVLCLFGIDSHFSKLSNLSSDWTTIFNYYDGGGGMSAAPIYLGLMAIVGAYLIKNNARYIFISKKSNKVGKEGKENEGQ